MFSTYIGVSILSMSVQLEYKKGHEERVSKYTTFADPPEVLLAKTQSQIASNVSLYRRSMHHRLWLCDCSG